MELLLDVVRFSLKVLIGGGIMVSTVVLGVVIVGGLRRHRSGREDGEIRVECLNSRYETMSDGILGAVLGKKGFRRHARKRRREKKQKDSSGRQRIFVLDFKGDVTASDVSSLREEISAVLGIAEPEDRVVVRLESGGGIMPAYGLAASQLARVRDRGIPLTICVDKIAASGGYMMASVADRIVAAPFAIVGSIGVVAMLPNVHRLLKSRGVDYEELTAGEFKRTVSVFGEITEKGRAKFVEELEDSHRLFKDFVRENRSSVDIDQVSTGEHWFGKRALSRNLVDELRTSDDYLLEQARDNDLFRIEYLEHKPIRARIFSVFSRYFDGYGRCGDEWPTPVRHAGCSHLARPL